MSLRNGLISRAFRSLGCSSERRSAQSSERRQDMTHSHHPARRNRALHAVRAATLLIASVTGTCMVFAAQHLEAANPAQAATPPGAHSTQTYTAEASTHVGAPGRAR